MVFLRKRNYYRDLIHYLTTFKNTAEETYKILENEVNYLKQRLNDKSAIDNTCILVLEKQKDKFNYLEKYIDIAIKYFEEI